MVFAAAPRGIDDRTGTTTVVVLEDGGATQRVQLVDRQAVFVELDDRDVTEGVGDAPLSHWVKVLEAVVVEAAVTPGVIDPLSTDISRTFGKIKNFARTTVASR